MKKPFLIGITGGSGSGKTTFIRQLRDGLDGSLVSYLSMDDYYLPRDQQKVDPQGVINFDRPKSIYRDEFVRDLKKLCNGKTITRQEYVFNNELATPRQIVVNPAPVIIVEGLFVFHYKELRKMLDLRIFLHAKDNLKVIRRIKRDQIERNYPLDDVLYRYEHHVLPSYEKYVEPYISKADIIVNNNTDFNMGLQVVRAFVETKI
jgi:uridine kinase